MIMTSSFFTGIIKEIDNEFAAVASDGISAGDITQYVDCLLYTSPSPRDGLLSRMPSSA